ncbi:hypothetical protein K469DRAFT_707775 [Zopfia rhizophila CBS 207.26]|uniref:Uncharacterized protein n=1 Tax=Zopfia rhizophila CBS 207.26 TaxID=1314779 RepID=A0A6A6E5T9_9PEZI|nr:hypothetical protein K469DRAFT_707775 [Zopfia rhizophila CBS 207.26]
MGSATKSKKSTKSTPTMRRRGAKGRFAKPPTPSSNTEPQVQEARKSRSPTPQGSELRQVSLATSAPGNAGLQTQNAMKSRAPTPKASAMTDPERPLFTLNPVNARNKQGRKGNLSCYPRMPYNEAEVKRRRKAWRARWTNKPYNPETLEEKLRSEFWWSSTAMPRCYSCKVSGASLPSDADAPDGTESKDILPCGCLYHAALLEMWAVKKGLFIDAEIDRETREKSGEWVEHIGPKSFGKHKLLLLRFWEMLFGHFEPEVMFNIRGRRESMIRVFCDKEEQGEFKLAPNPGYVIRVNREDIGKRKRKGSGKPTKPYKKGQNPPATRVGREEESEEGESEG